MKKVVLAFSGGLDTSYCVKYLAAEGLAVHTVTVNTGGFSPSELAQIEAHAQRLGVASHATLEATEYYYNSAVKYLLFGNVLKNGTYPLSVSAERCTQALKVAEYARSLGADYVAHGSTGAGNDQIRFDLVFNILLPGVQVLTPIRQQGLSRQAEIDYLKAAGVEMNFAKSAYSINKGLWGTSVGGRETLTSDTPLPESAWPTPLAATEPMEITLHFTQGEITGVNGVAYTPVAAIQALQALAGPYAIGRDVHVGDTIIGIKGRVGFEAAAPLLLIKAHHLLEKHTLTKWQLYWKDQLATWYGAWLHEGQFLDPTLRDIEQFMQSTQQNVSGEVRVRLLPYRFELLGITSPHDLMQARFGSYGEENKAWSGRDAEGFTRIFGNALAIYHSVNGLKLPSDESQ